MKTDEKLLLQAVEVLSSGGVIVFPTDTAFGVGCRLDRPEAVKRLFAVRKRPETQAVPVLVDSIQTARDFLLPFPAEVENLMKTHWPGALTIVYFCQTEKVPALVRGGGQTLGVRMPSHETPLKLIKMTGVPILAPSANFHNASTPYKLEDLDKDFIKLVDLVILGECPVGNVSTVVDCTQEPWQIIRQGALRLRSG